MTRFKIIFIKTKIIWLYQRCTKKIIINFKKEELIKRSSDVFGLVIKKKITVNIHKIFSLEEAKFAHKEIKEGKTTGKILLSCLKKIIK
jgi:NADPH:quinone reductase-like Zn-dependent oxidoreductase